MPSPTAAAEEKGGGWASTLGIARKKDRKPETRPDVRCPPSFPVFQTRDRSLTMDVCIPRQFGALASLQAHAEEALAQHRARKVRHAVILD